MNPEQLKQSFDAVVAAALNSQGNRQYHDILDKHLQVLHGAVKAYLESLDKEKIDASPK